MCWLRDRFLRKHVESCSGDDAFLQTPLHAVKVHDLASGGVHEDGAAGQEAEKVVADHVACLAGAGAVDAQRRRPAEELLDVLCPLDVEGLVGAVGLVGVVEEDFPPECLGAEGGGRADATQTQHAEGGALDAFDERSVNVRPWRWLGPSLPVVMEEDPSSE